MFTLLGDNSACRNTNKCEFVVNVESKLLKSIGRN